MVISPAYAQDAGGLGGFDLLSLAPLVLIFVVFYFLLIRPQQKKAKDHREMIGAVRRGDNVVTGGGIIGRVTKVIDDERVQVQIADDVRVEIARPTLANVLARGAPAFEKKEAFDKKDKKRIKKPERLLSERNYYEVLGVAQKASENEIGEAYRELAKETHPDIHPDDEQACKKFQEISEAHEILGDPESRAEYDELGHSVYVKKFQE